MAYNGAGDDGYEHHQLHDYNQEQQHPTGVSAPLFLSSCLSEQNYTLFDPLESRAGLTRLSCHSTICPLKTWTRRLSDLS